MEAFDYVFRVHAGDTDYGGVMYHPNYIDFFERARVEWFIHLGIHLADWVKQGVHFPVATLTIDYLKPAFFNDELIIKSRIAKAGKVSLVFDQEMFKGIDLIAKTLVKVGCIDQNHKPLAIPEKIRRSLEHA